MKAFAFVLVTLAASVVAVPSKVDLDRESQNLIEKLIVNTINRITSGIQERGLDPIYVEKAEGDYTFPISDIFSASGTVAELALEGISNVVVNDVTFNLLRPTTFSIDLALPKLSASAVAVNGQATIFGRELAVASSGSLVVEDIRLVSTVSLRLLPSINVRELSAVLTVGNVESALKVVLFGNDVSEKLNDALNNRLPELLETYNEQIREIVERIILFIINNIL
ncbi:uncharacterized protein LOC114249975 [Bombyx mandarina]|uniref:Uncharacterized protein n=2 Tax=Bombyx TaxID=7090 RepID=A0A8R2ANF6_BOMMO|nr:uncharacterized protein LOC101735309 [Bombyx mori]XP_028039511.1 uncharacterized protein LOC114249975 [Bombyx mandarina]